MTLSLQSQQKVPPAFVGVLNVRFSDLVCGLGDMVVRCYGDFLFKCPLKSSKGQRHLLLYTIGPDAWLPGASSAACGRPLHEDVFMPRLSQILLARSVISLPL